MDIMALFEQLQDFFGPYGFWMILVFGILHPLTENPWSFFTLSLAIAVLGIPLGYSTLLLGNIIGILLLYLIARGINRWTKYYLLKKNISKKILNWIDTTDTWRHIIVIGVPSIPTYPIKVALPFSRMSFGKYFGTLLGAYLFLHVANSLLYFGLLGFVTDTIPDWVSVVLLALFALYIYFGKTIRQKWRNPTIEEVNHE